MVNTTIGQHDAIAARNESRQRAEPVHQPVSALFQECDTVAFAGAGRQNKFRTADGLINPDCNPPRPGAAPDRHFNVAAIHIQDRRPTRHRLRPRPPNLRR